MIQRSSEDTRRLQRLQTSVLDMSGKAAGKRPVSIASDVNSNHTMVSDVSPEQQPNGRASRSSKKAVTFGKRSNSMRRNPKAEVAKQGWLYKQASNGVKQWNKRWFVLTDRCLFYYKDEKEEGVLGSIPLLSFRIGGVQPSDNISRKYAFKACCEEEEEGEGSRSNGSSAFCLQAEHAGIRTYYFSAECREEQESWVRAMSDAARVYIVPTQRNNTENIPPSGTNNTMVTKAADPHQRGEGDGRGAETRESGKRELNGVGTAEMVTPTSPLTPDLGGRVREERGVNHPNGWGNYAPPNASAFQPREPRETREARENAVLRRGFVPRTQPERMAQRKSSMTQLQQWVNLRRGMSVPDELRSPSHYYAVNRGAPADYYGMYGPQYVEEYGLYPPGVRPDSICSVTPGFERVPPRWVPEEKRTPLRDGPLYARERPREPVPGSGYQWAPQAAMPPTQQATYYTQMDSAQNTMRRLSMQPRSRSVPRSPSTTQGPYAPGTRAFSPARSPSARFDRGAPGRFREEVIYADPSAYALRRSMSSPKYEYPGDRRSMPQGIYPYNYPGSPSLRDKMEDILDLQLQRNLEYLDQQVTEGDHLISMVHRMVENSSPRAKLYSQPMSPYNDIYRDMHPAFKANEMEIDKLLGRLCEQNRVLKDQEAAVQRLHVDKDNLEGALVATHQELEMYRSQPALAEKLQVKKESLQNQLINIRGELSQATSALASARLEFEAQEDEVSAVHSDLWEQLNAGGQNELLHRHLQKEFWRIQDVLEGLHKNNPSRGTDTAKSSPGLRVMLGPVTSAASGSFSTNSPASPESSVSLTSPISPFSPISGSQASPTKPVSIEHKFRYQPDHLTGDRSNSIERQECEQDQQANQNKGACVGVGVVPPRTKSPAEDEISYSDRKSASGKLPNGHLSRERPKSAVFSAEVKSKMTVEEQNERIKRNQSSSMRDKRRSLQLSSGQQIDGFKSTVNYRVVRRRLTAHEVDIKDLEAAVRGEGVESPRQEIARLRRLQIEPEHYDLDIGKELLAPDKVLIPERYLDAEPEAPLSPEEVREKQKKVERIKTLIAKSNMQNIVPLLDGPAEAHGDTEQQLQEQEKRIEISCALAAEASRRSRLLSAQCAPPSPPASPTDLAPPPSADLSDSSHFMKV
ncbi:pleckstrin homology domain-containing family A member 6 isoform X3 [Amia ocellicauda]